MSGFILKRTTDTFAVLFLALTAVFGMTRLSGDPVMLLVPLDASPEFIADFRQRLGYDRPILVQYADFLLGAVVGDFGTSSRNANIPALSLVMDRLPASLLLSSVSITIALLVAVPLGALSSLMSNGIVDRLLTGVSVLGQSIPNFWLGLMLVLLFSVHWNLLPTGGAGTLKHLVLPSITLATYSAARIQRLTRSSMLEVLSADYIRTARSKGVPSRWILFKHALRNALVPVITITALQFGHTFGSAVIVETIFSWPGVGRLLVQSIEFRDFTVVLAGVFVVSAMYVTVNFLADVLYAVVDPQIRYK